MFRGQFLRAILLASAFILSGAGALATELVPESDTLAVGEETQVRLQDKPFLAVVTSWSVNNNLELLDSSSDGARVKAIKPGKGTVRVRVNGLMNKAGITVTGAGGEPAKSKGGQDRDKNAAGDDDRDEAGGGDGDRDWIKLSGMLRGMSVPDLDVRIARMMYEVKNGQRSPESFFAAMGQLRRPDGGPVTMRDVINTKKVLNQLPDRSLQTQVMGGGFAEGGSPVERAVLSWRKEQTKAAIAEVIQSFQGRLPKNDFSLVIAHVGKWSTQADRALTFSGDIDFSFVSNDVELAAAMKKKFAEVIQRRTGLDPIAIDSVATVHGRAGLEVYTSTHGMAFVEEMMKNNELVDLRDGSIRALGLEEMKRHLATERSMAEARNIDIIRPNRNGEPGVSMEMARHFEHDIVKPRIFNVQDAVVKAAKYLDRSNQALEAMAETLKDPGLRPGDADLAAFVRQITAMANNPRQTPELRNEMVRLISERLGSEPRVVWEPGAHHTESFALTLDEAQVAHFHEQVMRAMLDNVQQGYDRKVASLDQRLRDLLGRERSGDDVRQDAEALRQEMVELVDMVEAEMKSFGEEKLPMGVLTNNAKVKQMIDTLAKRTGTRVLSPDELKNKQFVEELLRGELESPNPSRRAMVSAFIMNKTMAAMDLAAATGQRVNTVLDYVDDTLLGPLRGDGDFAAFEAEMKAIRQAEIDAAGGGVTARASALKSKVAAGIKRANMEINEVLQRTANRRRAMQVLMVYNLVDEMNAYYDAYSREGWGALAAEMVRRRVPFGSAAEALYMGNNLRAAWDTVTTLVPPLALYEAAYGMTQAAIQHTQATYWSEQLALFSDTLYAGAKFKLTEVETYENAKMGVYRLESVKYGNLVVDLREFADQRQEQIKALKATVDSGKRVDWRAYAQSFQGITELVEVSEALKRNLTDTDPVLLMLEEMITHPSVGPELTKRLTEQGLLRWEEIKFGYLVNLVNHLEARKQADQGLASGQLPALFEELRKIAAELDIEAKVMAGLDAEVNTSNLKALIKWLWDAKRYTLGQPPTESETERAAQEVKRYLDAYKEILGLRDGVARQLGDPVARNGNQRYIHGGLFLTGRAGPDLKAAREWVKQVGASENALRKALLDIKRKYLPKAQLDNADDKDYFDRAFPHALWMKPYKDGGPSWLEWAIMHGKKRNEILDEYDDWLKRQAPVELTVKLVDAADAKRVIGGASGRLVPTDELGKAASASSAGNTLVFGVPTGRYRLTVAATGYAGAEKNLLLGRNLNPTPSETIALKRQGKPGDKDDKDDTDKPVKPGEPDKPDPSPPPGEPDNPPGDDATGGPAGGDTGGAGKPDKPLPPRAAGGGASGMFPGEPFNGMQISYAVSGCDLPKMTDSPGFGTYRSYEGRLGSGNLTVSGSARMGGGYGADLTVSVSAGGKSEEFKAYIKSGFPSFNSQSFNLSVPIPADATSGGFSIKMDGHYSMGGGWRGLGVSGSCTADGPTGAAPDGTAPLEVSLSGPKDPVPFGKEATVNAQVKGGRFPYSYQWTGASGNEQVQVKMDRMPQRSVALTVTDSDGKRGGANLTIKTAPLKFKLGGVPGKPIYGTRADLTVSGEGLPAPAPAADPCAGRTGNSNNPFDECNVITGVQTVPGVSAGPVPTVPIPSAAGSSQPSRPAAAPGGPRFRYIWQSEPGLTFNPGTSENGKTTVTFDRMGQVKIWCEVLMESEGAFVTVGETDQVTVTVVAPAFSVTFTPPDRQGRVGQEIVAKVSSKPEIPAKLVDYRWFSPASSNRMEYTDNASEIGFKLKDTQPLALEALARVPYHGDEIAKVTASYTAVAYEVKASVLEPGVRPMMWDPVKKGLVPVPKGQWAVDERIGLRAELIGEPRPAEVRWNWTVNEDTSLSNPISQTPTVSRHEPGGITAKVTARDKDGVVLGSADVSLSVTVSAENMVKPPSVTLTPDRSSLETGQSVTFRAEASGGTPPYRYAWQGASGQGSQVTVKPTQPGRVNVTVTLTDSKGRSATASAGAEVKASQSDKNVEQARKLVEQARQSARQGKLDDAAGKLEQARKLHPPTAEPAIREVRDQARQAAQAAEGKRDFKESGRLFGIAQRLDPGDMEAARGVNNAPPYQKRVDEIRAWQKEAEGHIGRGDWHKSAEVLDSIQRWEATLPGAMFPETRALMDRHEKGYAAYRKEVDARKAEIDKDFTGRRLDPARDKVLKLRQRHLIPDDLDWTRMMLEAIDKAKADAASGGRDYTSPDGGRDGTSGGVDTSSQNDGGLWGGGGSTPPRTGPYLVDLTPVGGKRGGPETLQGVPVDSASWLRLKATDENRRRIDVRLPSPVRASALVVLTNLDDATYLAQGRALATLTVETTQGSERFEFRAGVNTAEWNIAAHKTDHQAPPAAAVSGNRYLAGFRLAGSRMVTGLRFDYIDTGAKLWSGHAPGFVLRGITLLPDGLPATVGAVGGAGTADGQTGGQGGGGTEAGLIASYPLNGDARDSSGNNRHGTVQGARPTSDRAGKANGAMLFSGKDAIELPIDINPGTYPRLTFTAWVRADDIGPIRQVMSHDNGGFDRSLGIDHRGGGNGWSMFTGSGAVLGVRPADKGRWVFVAGVWDQPARKARLHVDDKVFEKGGESGGGHAGKMYLGKNPSYGEFFVGAIDDVRLYARALSHAEIASVRGSGVAGGTGAGSTGGTAGFSGDVSGPWRTSEGDMTLSQTGRQVVGRYNPAEHAEIQGVLSGNVLEGWWIEDASGVRCSTPRNGRYNWGRIRWVFEDDRFSGHWSYCDGKPDSGWTGQRGGPGAGAVTPPAAPIPTPGRDDTSGRDYTWQPGNTPASAPEGGEKKSGTGIKEVDELLDAVEQLKGIFKW